MTAWIIHFLLRRRKSMNKEAEIDHPSGTLSASTQIRFTASAQGTAFADLPDLLRRFPVP
jgi:hypothetical protein